MSNVIGKTKSGKDVFENFEDNINFSKQDHEDAMNIWDELSCNLYDKLLSEGVKSPLSHPSHRDLENKLYKHQLAMDAT